MNGCKKSKAIKLNLLGVNRMTEIYMAMVATECSGFAKIGGLGDVVKDLSHSLVNKVGSIAVFLPGYAVNAKAKTIYTCTVIFSNRPYLVKLKHFNHNGVRFYFICNKTFFGGKYSKVYTNSNSQKKGPFEDDARRFAFYDKAVLEILLRCKRFKNINLLHCHDWHTGFLFLLLEFANVFKPLRQRLKTVFTIHNLNYQGIRPFVLPFDFLRQTSLRSWTPILFGKLSKSPILQKICYPSDKQPLPENEINQLLLRTKDNPELHNKIKNMYKFDFQTGFYHIQEDFSDINKKYFYQELINRSCLCFNPMRAAINLSNQISTVSNTYASEITFHNTKKEVYGCGLESDLKERFINNQLTGIINGIDYNYHNPKYLKFPFDTKKNDWQTIKKEGKKKLLEILPQVIEEIQLRQGKNFFNYQQVISHLPHLCTADFTEKPLFAFVGRVVEQKIGMLFPDDNFVFIEKLLKQDAFFIFTGTGNLDKKAEKINQYPNALYLNVFDEEIGNLLYGYSDFFLMPSYYEPCGISQLIAMRYGTLPIVHDVGGLHDTVNDNETGFKFNSTSGKLLTEAFLEKINYATECFYNLEKMQYMRKEAAQVRFNWDKTTIKYLSMYKSLF